MVFDSFVIGHEMPFDMNGRFAPKAAVGRHAIVRSFFLDDGSLARPNRGPDRQQKPAYSLNNLNVCRLS